MDKKKVYSYLRFSDPKQSLGHSAERQLEYAKRWASENNAELDTSLTLRDEGLSAYHQRHVKSGALGAFLRAVDEGRIESGSVLIVEGLDRLSRAEPVLAQAQLAQIINAGISVVTASDGKIYNRARLKEQPMDLVYSLLVMIRAHEESDTKSKRVSAAIRRQCEAWQAGTYKGIIRNGKDPGWLRWDGKQFHEIPERAEPMRKLLNLWLDGHGYASAYRTMIDNGCPPNLLPITQATFYRMVSRKYIIGTKSISVDGHDFDLENYYPPLVDVETFTRIYAARGKRKWKRGPSSIPSVLFGMQMTYCGYCGSPMIAQNLMNRPLKVDGTLQDGHRRTRCQHSVESCISGSCSAVPLERAIMNYCSDQFRLDSLVSTASAQSSAANSALAIARKRVFDIEAKLEKITAALVSDDGAATPITFIRAARDLESQLAEAQAAEENAEIELRRVSIAETPTATTWASLTKGVLSLDLDARMKARKLVQDTFERIAIYVHGVQPGDPRTSPIDVVLVGKGGTSRMIRINRRSGELIELEDFTTPD